MSKEKMYELREMLCRELDKIPDEGKLSAGSLETAYKLTDTIKNIDKISMLEDVDGYSQRGYWRSDGYYRDGNGSNGNGGGNSYDRGNSYRRDSMGRYSRDSMMDHIDRMMSEAGSDREREKIRRFREEMSNA